MTLALAAALLIGQGQLKPVQMNPQTKYPVLHIVPSVVGVNNDILTGPDDLDQRFIDCLKTGSLGTIGKDVKLITGSMVKVDGTYRTAIVQAGLESAAVPYSPENLEKLRLALGLPNLVQISLTGLKAVSTKSGLGKTNYSAQATGTLVFTPPFRSTKATTNKISGGSVPSATVVTKENYSGAINRMCREASEMIRPWVK